MYTLTAAELTARISHRKPSKASVGALTRERVIAEARDLIRAEDTGALSIRKLAARLSVTPMALYRHVADKQDLLEAVLAQAIDDDAICDHHEEDWRAWMVETCVRMRQSLMLNPEILTVLAETERMSGGELATFDDVLSHLVAAGLSDEAAAKVFHVTVSFTFGSLAFDRFKTRKLTGKKLPTKKELAAAHPAVARAARHLSAPLSAAEFKAGLTRILKGF